jgi:hypothetical protein
MKSKVVYLLAAAMMIFLGYLTEHVEEIIWTFGPLLLFSFVLGVIAPKRAWLWGLLIFLTLPLAGFVANLTGYHPPFPTTSFISPFAVIPLGMAVVSAYCGAAVNHWLYPSAETIGSSG